MIRLIAISNTKAKIRRKIARNYFIRYYIKKNQELEFKKTCSRSREFFTHKVKKYMANTNTDQKYLKNEVSFNTAGQKINKKLYLKILE